MSAVASYLMFTTRVARCHTTGATPFQHPQPQYPQQQPERAPPVGVVYPPEQLRQLRELQHLRELEKAQDRAQAIARRLKKHKRRAVLSSCKDTPSAVGAGLTGNTLPSSTLQLNVLSGTGGTYSDIREITVRKLEAYLQIPSDVGHPLPDTSSTSSDSSNGNGSSGSSKAVLGKQQVQQELPTTDVSTLNFCSSETLSATPRPSFDLTKHFVFLQQKEMEAGGGAVAATSVVHTAMDLFSLPPSACWTCSSADGLWGFSDRMIIPQPSLLFGVAEEGGGRGREERLGEVTAEPFLEISEMSRENSHDIPASTAGGGTGNYVSSPYGLSAAT